ncbi:MAG: hypothetical protein AAF600_21980 [Bacteroidota bacterium]
MNRNHKAWIFFLVFNSGILIGYLGSLADDTYKESAVFQLLLASLLFAGISLIFLGKKLRTNKRFYYSGVIYMSLLLATFMIWKVF